MGGQVVSAIGTVVSAVADIWRNYKRDSQKEAELQSHLDDLKNEIAKLKKQSTSL